MNVPCATENGRHTICGEKGRQRRVTFRNRKKQQEKSPPSVSFMCLTFKFRSMKTNDENSAHESGRAVTWRPQECSYSITSIVAAVIIPKIEKQRGERRHWSEDFPKFASTKGTGFPVEHVRDSVLLSSLPTAIDQVMRIYGSLYRRLGDSQPPGTLRSNAFPA